METGSGPAQTQVFDLTSPPSRATASMAAGESQHSFQRSDHTPFPVRVKLPAGKELAFDAKLVGFDSLGAADPSSGPPSTMDVQFYASTLEVGRDHLAAALSDFGLDPSSASMWFEQARAVREARRADDVRTPWLSAKVGYLDLQIQAGYLSSGDDPGQTVVHYVFTWESPG